MTYDGDGQTYAYDPENRLTTVQKVPEPLAAACDIALTFTTSGAANWFSQTTESYNGNDAVQSGDISDNQETVLEATVPGTGTVTFWWKTSTQVGDEAAFYIDGVWKAGRSGISGWNSVSQTITTAGTHTLRWKYMKDGSGSSGSDCIWVDYVQWTGTMPSLGSWSTIAYTYDANGRRIEKKVDGTTQVKYVYDGDQIVAEYNNAGTLLRKYIHGAGIDQPICMIEASGSYAGTFYYHFDALGSVVGLTNSAGNMVELYEYSIYGQVAASDENHPNRFMFSGREFDMDTGLYYYRARHYHPEIGRFLQVDRVGYRAGLNLYRYCENNPWNMTDAYGRDPCDSGDPCDPCDQCNCDPCHPGNCDPNICMSNPAHSGCVSVGSVDASSKAMQARRRPGPSYSWTAPAQPAKAACCVARLPHIPYLSKYAAINIEMGWCNTMAINCRIWCEDNVPENTVLECHAKCTQAHGSCVVTAARGKCKFNFSISN
jgi:RHS repeat-associated protein